METFVYWIAVAIAGFVGLTLAFVIPMALFELLRWFLSWFGYWLWGGDRPRWQPIFGNGGEHYTGGI